MAIHHLGERPAARAQRPRRLLLKVIGSVLVLIALTALAVGVTFMPVRLQLPQLSAGHFPPASPPAGMSLSALPSGTYDTPAALAFRGGAWNQMRHFSSTALLIRHPKGNLLIDAGFGRHLAAHMQRIPSIQRSAHRQLTPVIDQLAAASMRPSDIFAVIPTHAHWDHVSGIDDLGGVPVMVSAAAKQWIASRAEGTEVINSFAHVNYRQYAFDDGTYLGFPASHNVWRDGAVVIVPAPGHTPDSVIVFVNLPSGAHYALVGDLVWQREGIDIPADKPWLLRWLIGEDDREIRKDIALIRDAVRGNPALQVVPAHEMLAFARIPVFPLSAH